MFKKVLVAYDGSPNGKRALEAAKSLMKADDEVETHILHVKQPPNMEMFSLYGVEMSKSMTDELNKLNERTMNQAKDVMQDEQTKCHFNQVTGEPAQSIMNYAHTKDIDLIIIGSRGLGAFKGMMLGSVSNRVTQQSDIHVMVIK